MLLVGEEERLLEVPRKSPPKVVKEGHWLKVEIEGDQVVSAVIDQEETARARQGVIERLERLRREEHLE